PRYQSYNLPIRLRTGSRGSNASNLYFLHTQSNSALTVDFQYLDPHHLAFCQSVADIGNAFIGNLGNVDQTLLAGKDIDERAKVHQLGHCAFVNSTHHDISGDTFNAAYGFLTGSKICCCDLDDAIISDIDHRAGFFSQGTNGDTTLANHIANFVTWNLNGQN